MRRLIPSDQLTAKSHPRKPDWLKVPLTYGSSHLKLKSLMRDQRLHTVCEEARCPNLTECWSRGTATFLLLGDVCTRSCGFCHIKTGRPLPVDEAEPERVAQAVVDMKLNHVVLTSVNRDERVDGGAHIFARTMREIRERLPDCTIEVLVPDFKGSVDALRIVTDEKPEIFNHNTETVPRLYQQVRPQAKYSRSLELLVNAKRFDPETLTKSGVMVGLGETTDELIGVMKDLQAQRVDILTIGQYLQPSPRYLPVERFVHPDEFLEYKRVGLALGFRWVESGPLVRSSYHAESQVNQLSVRRRTRHPA